MSSGARKAPRFPVVLLALLSVLLHPDADAGAQPTTGTIDGTVTGAADVVLSGASITVRNETIGLERKVITGQDGAYSVGNLPLQGTYEVRVEFSGFAPVVQSGVSLTTAASVTVDISMQAATEETLVVTGRVAGTEHERSTIEQTISEAMVHALPTIGRDFITLTSLTAGFTGNASYPSAQGQLYWSTNVLVDGASHYSKWRGAARTVYAGYPLEAIKEVRVLTSQFSAEYGEAMAAVTAATSNSGTNDFHGSALFFGQHGALNDIPAFTPVKPPFGAQRLGVTFGGPVARDRTHFFASYEGRRQRGHGIVVSPAASGSLTANNEDEHLFFIKIDRKHTERDLLSVRYNGQRFRWRDEPGGLLLPGVGTQWNDDVHTFLASKTTLLTNATLNQLRFQFARYTDRRIDLQPSVFVSRAGYSIQGGLLGPYGFGATPEDTWEAADTLSYKRLDHSMKVGGGLKYVRAHNESLPYGHGAYFFAGAPSAFRQPYAFIQGLAPTDATASADPRSIAAFLFAQDDWRIADRLTLSLGLRYDVESIRHLTGFDVPADRNNVQPRAGMAWQPFGGAFVVRGGFGVYNQQHLLFYLNKVQLEGPAGTSTITLAQGSPLMPEFPGVLPRSLPNAPPRDVQMLAAEFRNPFSVQSTIGVEHVLAGTVIGADVVYLRGLDLMSLVDINAPASIAKPATRSVAQADATRPTVPAIGGLRKVVALGNEGDSWYRALQIKANRSAGRIQATVAYSLARAEDQANYLLPEDSRNLAAERARADNDIRHSVALGFSWQIPAVRPLLNGLSLSGVGTFRSNRPYTVYWGDDRNGTSQNDARPAGRNTARTTGYRNVDLALARYFRVGSQAIEGRLEAFNVLSTLNFDQYVGALSSSLFGSPVTAFPRRRLQFAVIVRF